MKILETPQGSRLWFEARAGIPTASCFSQILTPATLKLSSQAAKYMHRLVAERITGQVFEVETHVWAMERGLELEQEAIDFFELTTGRQTSPGNFCLSDDGRLGCSPDRLVEDNALLELKCPLAPTHVGYLLHGELPDDYRIQVQGQLLVTGRSLCYFQSYYPGLPPLLLEIKPDPQVQAALRPALKGFCDGLDAAVAKVRGMMDPLDKSKPEA